MDQYFIGVDGGGTRVRIRVEDAARKLVLMAEGGAANIRVSPVAAWHEIMTALQLGFKQHQLSFPANNSTYYASMGLAGSECQSALDAFLQYAHPFTKLIVSSDAKTACLGAHGNASGAIIIVGTGIIGYQQENDAVARVGGWGFPHDDTGSGAYLGMQAVRAMFAAFDGRAAPSLLTKGMREKWHAPDVLLAHFNHASPKVFASVVPLIFEAALQQDKIALELIDQTTRAIYDISNALFQQQLQSDEPLPLALLGGLSVPLMPYLNDTFKQRLCKPLMSPEEGALLLLR